MRNSPIQLMLAILTLVIGAGVEELLPKVLGVGFPILLLAALRAAFGSGKFAAALFALAAGAMEDAISGLPLMASTSYFLVAVVAVRSARLSWSSAVLVYPLYQVWLAVWLGASGGGVFGRVLISTVFGAVTGVAVWSALAWVEGKAAVDEQG